MNKATESNSPYGFKLLLHGLRKFGNLSINESKWKSINKEISLQRTSPAVLPRKPLASAEFESTVFAAFAVLTGCKTSKLGKFWSSGSGGTGQLKLHHVKGGLNKN